jgi:hypothetical protein
MIRMTSRHLAGATITAATLAALVASPSPALASGGGGDVRASGACSGSAHWTLKAKHDNGVIETQFEVDSNRSGQVWRVRLFDNGERFFAGLRTTQPPSGSFEVSRSTANRVGTDHITGRAVDVNSGQTCVGHVAL